MIPAKMLKRLLEQYSRAEDAKTLGLTSRYHVIVPVAIMLQDDNRSHSTIYSTVFWQVARLYMARS